MIKLQNSVPEVYYDSSRDFQLIGRLFDLVVNSCKTEAELLNTLPFSDNSPDNLLELLTLTFGLKLDLLKYTDKQLRAICSIAAKLMRTKGSLTAAKLLCTALVNVDGISDEVFIEQVDGQLIISLPNRATCKEILYDILPWVLPAGLPYTVRTAFVIQETPTDVAALTDTVVVNKQVDDDSASMLATSDDLKLGTLTVIGEQLGSNRGNFANASLYKNISEENNKND